MKKILSLIILFTLFSCKEPKPISSKKTEFDRIDSIYLKNFNAGNPKYSLLIFGMGYFDTNLVVENCQELKPEDSIKTLNMGPFSKIYRIDNTCRTNVTDLKRTHHIEFNIDSIRKYKFIYVRREFNNDSLSILFTNNHSPVK